MKYEIKTFTVKLKLKETKKEMELLTSPLQVEPIARGIFATLDADQEHFIMLLLNVQNELIGYKHLNSGTIDQVAVYPRIVMRNAILMGAAGIILVHNHPSGHVVPSEEDKRLTNAIKTAGELLDVRVLDHIIIGGGTAIYSFRENSLI